MLYPLLSPSKHWEEVRTVLGTPVLQSHSERDACAVVRNDNAQLLGALLHYPLPKLGNMLRKQKHIKTKICKL